MAISSPTWRLLTSSLKVTGSPTLLIKHEMPQTNGIASKMKVCITDLTYLWTETLSRYEVGQKAYGYSSPIDPMGYPDLLLASLDRGLSSGPKTSLSLRSEKGRAHLVLHMTCEVSHPETKETVFLHWDSNLRQASEIEFTREFVLPLVGNLFENSRANADLTSIIADKDKALQRIETELKVHNKEITGLFDRRFFGEHAPEKHKRGILMNKLPGFKPFDYEKWQDGRADVTLPKHRDLNKHVFEHGINVKVTSDTLSEAVWWEDLGNAVEVEEPSQISQPALLHRASTSAFDSSQTQRMVDRDVRNHRNNIHSSSPVEERSTSANNNDGDQDSDATASTISDLDSTAPSAPSRPIGRIGRGKEPIANEKQSTAQSPDPENRPGSRTTDIEANKGRPRGGIGKIGGLRRPQNVTEDPNADLSQSRNIPTRPNSKPEVEAIGRMRKDPAAAVETRDHSADRRRELLKHNMEDKKNAPVKKKRRF